MGRARKFPPTVHKHASGQAFFRHKGQDYYLGVYGSPEAQKEYVRLINELTGGTPAHTGGGMTVAEVTALWLAGPGTKYSASGREQKQYCYSVKPLNRLFGKLPAEQFGTDELEQVQEAMITGSWLTTEERADLAKRRRPVGWCKNVVNRRIVRIRTVWKWAERRKLVPKGAHAHLQTLEPVRDNHARVRKTESVRPPSWETVQKVLAAMKRSRQPAAMLRLIWWSGMRPDEVRRFNLADLDRSGEVWLYSPDRHKNAWRGQSRVVALGPKSQEILEPWLVEAEKAGRALVFPASGDGYTAFSFAQALRRACRRAGVPVFTPKALRHAAKRRVTRVEGMDAARSLLGQKSIGTTAGYDAEVDVEHAIEVARKMG